ncbi:MAG: N-acetylmuramoyl-L-alanine amidase [Candidatus Omnitrophota bacterium]
MKKLILLVFLLLITACETTTHRGAVTNKPQDFIYIDDFCKKHNLQYNFDTFDDIVKMFSKENDIRLILNTNIAYFNGAHFELKNVPQYSSGKLFVPQDLEKIIFFKEPASLKAAFLIKTIVIDPGHGGKDPGAISCRGYPEKDLNLKIAKYLKDELEQRGFTVFLTRTKDVYLTLQERVNLAKCRNADIFISIHGNSNRSRRLRGMEVYYLSPARLDAQARALKLAKEENFYSYKLTRDAEAILWDMVLTKNYSLSVDLSRSIYFSFKSLGFKVDLPRRAPYYVLRLAYVPAVLVETGYLSNRYEEKFLRKDSYQMQIAEAIALAVVSMNKDYDSLVRR